MEFVEAIERQSQQRICDLAHVVVNAMLSFYGPTQQTARTLVEEFHSILGEGEVIDALRSELKQRPEFQKVSVLPPQMQMRFAWSAGVKCSIYSAMEMCLRLRVFTVTDATVLLVIQEAAKPFDANSTNDAMIKGVTATDCGCRPCG